MGHFVFLNCFSLLLLFSNYFWAKIKCIGATLTVVYFAADVRSRHTTPSIPRRRESYCVTRPDNGYGRDYAYSRFSNRKNIKIIRLQLVASKI